MENLTQKQFNKTLVVINNENGTVEFLNYNSSSTLYKNQILKGDFISTISFCNNVAEKYEKAGEEEKAKDWLEVAKFILENAEVSLSENKNADIAASAENTKEQIFVNTEELLTETDSKTEEVKEEKPAPKKRGRKPKTEK